MSASSRAKQAARDAELSRKKPLSAEEIRTEKRIAQEAVDAALLALPVEPWAPPTHFAD